MNLAHNEPLCPCINFKKAVINLCVALQISLYSTFSIQQKHDFMIQRISNGEGIQCLDLIRIKDKFRDLASIEIPDTDTISKMWYHIEFFHSLQQNEIEKLLKYKFDSDDAQLYEISSRLRFYSNFHDL